MSMTDMDHVIERLRELGIEKQRKPISLRRRKIVYKRDGGKCRYCGKPVEFDKFHVDHIRPRHWWGNDYVFNLATACPNCNLSKGSDKNIVPGPLGLVKRIYEIIMIVQYGDFPSLEDFI